MRLSGALILVVVLAMGVVVLLQGRDVERARDSVTVMATQLREEGVAAAAFDRDRALAVIAVLNGLVDDPEAIGDHLEDLKTIAATAAGWAAGAPSPSPELHAAVAIRTAAGELREHALRPSPSRLSAVRRELERARHALTVAADGSGTTAPSGLVTEGVRDRLNNLEAAQKERALEVDEGLGP
ncbi:MAG TPA: hypothetical protein VLT32_18620 [Candidatus Sulfomarinibacteraceae bacterium]|jgi:hypothetical protein|nr:hypothetical protein [Candidatus Sulfomarinibacteraceae bacterium]